MKKKWFIIVSTVVLLTGAIYLIKQHKSSLSLELVYDYVSCDTLQQANEEADYIIKGQFVSYQTDWQLMKSSNSQSLDRVAKLYQFQIDDVYKGNIDDRDISIGMDYSTRLFFDHEGLLDDRELSANTQENYIDYVEATYMKPVYDQEYILYLNYNEQTNYYEAAFYPYMIAVYDQELDLIDTTPIENLAIYTTKNYCIKMIVNYYAEINFIEGYTLDELIKNIEAES